MWILTFNYFESFIKNIHKLFFIINFNYLAILIIFSETCKQTTELNSCVSIFDKFSENVRCVFFEYVNCSKNGEEVTYLLLKLIPTSSLRQRKILFNFMFVQHCKVANMLEKFFIRIKFLSSYFHSYPS